MLLVKFTGCRVEIEWKSRAEKAVVRQQAGTLGSRLSWWAMRETRTDCFRVEEAAKRKERSRRIHSALRS